jgi:hypothetical protein
MRDKKEQRMKEQVAGTPDELAMELGIRKRYKQNWPKVILELTKRVSAVNTTWGQIVNALMMLPGMRISWYQNPRKEGMIVEVSYKTGTGKGEVPVEEVELHEIPTHELMESQGYIEVVLMDKLDHSKLIHTAIKDRKAALEKKPDLPG